MIGAHTYTFITLVFVCTNIFAKDIHLYELFYDDKNEPTQRDEKVDLEIYYESHCPYSIDFMQNQLKKIIIDFNQYLNITTHPYGNAKTIMTRGQLKFKCQHGPKECYGNKLHACALKHISNHTKALLFNICLMTPNNWTKGSDDATASKCAKEMNVNENLILRCAKGKNGSNLLKYYGEKSKVAHFSYVPYVLINGIEWEGVDLEHDVCAEFLLSAPEKCHQ